MYPLTIPNRIWHILTKNDLWLLRLSLVLWNVKLENPTSLKWDISSLKFDVIVTSQRTPGRDDGKVLQENDFSRIPSVASEVTSGDVLRRNSFRRVTSLDLFQKSHFRRNASKEFLQESPFITLASEESPREIYFGGIPSGESLREKKSFKQWFW